MKVVIASVLLAASALTSQAAVVINAAEVGGNVVFTGSGSIDLTGAVAFGSGNVGTPGTIIATANILGFDFPGGGSTVLPFYNAVRVGSIGPGGSFPTAIATGDSFLLFLSSVGLPPAYVSGAPLNFSATYVGTNFAGLGINSPGTVTWTLPSDTVTLNIPVSTVPEPSTYIAGAGLLGLGALVLYRRRKQAKAAQ
ncbi:MAG: LPXTG cell wall anchor domain-containing protein [Verrucomicrobiota bacterium]